MELRGDKLAYGEYYRVIGNNPEKQSITYLIGVSEWQSGETYKITQLVRVPDHRTQYTGYYQIYRCKTNHISALTFSSDLSKWEQLSLHLQEVRDDVIVTSPLQHNPTNNTFSISQSNTSTNGYLSSSDWNIFNNKQENYTFRFIGQVNNSASLLLSNTDTLGKYECMLYKSSSTEVISYFYIVRLLNNSFDIYLKNDENLISDTQNTLGKFNMYLDNLTNNFYLQNNLGYSVYYNVYRTSFKTSFDPFNPFAP